MEESALTSRKEALTPPPVTGQFVEFEAPVDEDKRLVLAFKGGDTSSYDAIYERHADTVRRVCRRMLVNKQDADEAFQETFLKVYRALGRFNGRYQLGAWITRIATNVCLDQIRSKTRHPVVAVEPDSLDVDLEPAVAAEDSDPEYQVIRRQESRHVRRILEELPPTHRAAIILRDFECLSYAEVAHALDISESQTKALIHRARKSFKRTWTAPLAALLPWRLGQRFRRLDLADQPAQWLPASQTVVTCSSVMQQCGQFVIDKVMPIGTAALLGTATGAALTQQSPPTNVPERTQTVAAEEDAMLLTRVLAKRTHTEKINRPDVKPVAPPAETDEPADEPPVAEEPVVTDPEPTTEPEPETPAEPDGGTEPAPAPEPPPPPAPPVGFSLALALDGPAEAGSCTCAGPNGAASSSVGITSAGIQSFDQVLQGTMSANGHEYGAWVDHSTSSGSSHAMEFRLMTADGTHFYSASGTLTDRTLTAWNGWTYTYKGTYRVSSHPGGAAPMPTTGTYMLTVSASWEQNRIVATTISLDDDR
jgi:RNA polymerase sigma-70 factor (ECF subfamily)